MHISDIIDISKNGFTKEEIDLATHGIPRDMRGEGRILFIFSTKALIYTVITGGIGLLATSFMPLNITRVGIVLAFAGIGFVIGTFKIPDSNQFEVTRKLGGENIDMAILRWLKFKNKKRRIYLYTKEEK